jgi:hypothetical protein
LHLSVIVTGEDGHLEWVRQALLVHLAVGCQTEERLEERLRVERRSELDEGGGLLLARVPPDMGRARRDYDDLAGP